MSSKPRGLITLETQNAEHWKEGIERGQEQTQRVRVLCRALTNAGEALDEDDREIFSALIDELLRDVEGQFREVSHFFRDIERVGLHSITMKKQEAA